jgi:hypothetical protein
MSLTPGKPFSAAEFEALCFSCDLIRFERNHLGSGILPCSARCRRAFARAFKNELAEK